MAFTILWRQQNKAAAILSPVLGLATGLGVWLGTAKHFYGAVTVSTTGQILPCVYGTVASAFSPIVYSVVLTLLRPQNYHWVEFKKEKLALEELEGDLTTVHSHQPKSSAPSVKELKRWSRIAAFWSIATFLGHWVLWPLPMYGAKYVFGKTVSIRSHPCEEEADRLSSSWPG
jgi:Na+/proline symporter